MLRIIRPNAIERARVGRAEPLRAADVLLFCDGRKRQPYKRTIDHNNDAY
jgi:hypothetical protein